MSHYSLSLHTGHPKYEGVELVLFAGHQLPDGLTLNEVMDYFIKHLEGYKR